MAEQTGRAENSMILAATQGDSHGYRLGESIDNSPQSSQCSARKNHSILKIFPAVYSVVYTLGKFQCILMPLELFGAALNKTINLQQNFIVVNGSFPRV